MCTIYHHINNHMNHIISWLALVISCPSSMCLSESRGIWWHWRLSFTCRGRIRKSRASLLGFTRLVHVFHFFHSWWLRSYRIGKKKKTCEKREKHVKNLWKTCETCSGSWSRIPLVGSTRPNKSEANMKEMPFCPYFNFASISMRL